MIDTCQWLFVAGNGHLGGNLQAFFSAIVNWPQGSFIRSLRFIHRSACSLGGIDSHLFSMSASVTLETACEALRDWEITAVAARMEDEGEAETLVSLDARRTEVRNIALEAGDVYLQK